MKPLLTLLFLSAMSCYSQKPVDVTDQTIKLGAMKEEVLYFAFQQGDQIVFSFSEVDGKDLKEIEISEYPSVAKFSDFKTPGIENKIIHVAHKAVYGFRFYNGAVSGRICKISIRRIPADNSQPFSTNVTWVNKQDTTWNTYTKDVIAGYDTTYRHLTKKELVTTELKEELIFDKSQRVHSRTNENGNKSWLFFTLPRNQLWGYQTTKVISWAYWIGVGEEADAAWAQSANSITKLVGGAVGAYVSPLGKFAAGLIMDMTMPQIGEDVSYAITDSENKDYFMAGMGYNIFDQGKGIVSYRKFTDAPMCQGTYFVTMSNDNYTLGINVTVKVSAIIETKTYEDKPYTEQVVKPRYEKKIFSEPVISQRLVPVMTN